MSRNNKSKKTACANPVFEKWLVELRDDAVARDLQSKHTYTKCLNSMRRYPLPLTSGRDCLILEGFGDKICKLIDEKLDEFLQEGGKLHDENDDIECYNNIDDENEFNIETNSQPQSTKSLLKINNNKASKENKKKPIKETTATNSIDDESNEEAVPAKRQRNKEYLPEFRSGAYALLITLYTHHKNIQDEENSYMLKAQLIKEAQKHSDSSFVNTDPGSHYSAWNSMSNLIKKNLAIKENKLPARYRLTESGKKLAAKLLNEHIEEDAEVDPPTSRQPFNANANFEARCAKNSQAGKDDGIIELSDHDDQDYYNHDHDVIDITKSEDDLTDLANDEPNYDKHRYQSPKIKSPDQDLVCVLSDDDDNYIVEENVKRDVKFTVAQKPTQKSANSLSKKPSSLSEKFSSNKISNKNDDSDDELLADLSTTEEKEPPKMTEPKIAQTQAKVTSKPTQKSASASQPKPITDKVVSTQSYPALSRVNSLPTTTSASSSSSQPNVLFKFNPGDFDVILFVDNCEQSHAKKQDLLIDELKKANIKFESGKLNVGDFVWLARSKKPGMIDSDVILDFIVERKRMDDLCASIVDGRYKEQKFRLKKSGITKQIYLIEDYGSMKHLSLPEKNIVQADVNTQLIDGLIVHHTTDPKDSANYLIQITHYLTQKFRNYTLHACMKEELDEYNKQNKQNDRSNRTFLMTFEEFNQFSNKNKPLTVKEMFAKCLMKMQGLSQDKCLAILDLYPTPSLLFKEYSKCVSEASREKLLANIKYGAQQRNIGPAISKMIAQLIYSNEPLH